ncbi:MULTISPECIES: hypothetical protein [unclassified Desulfovibrio]|uniref:hypothetical protein n=1 Tax=unclassified Desulfovibrio TaxID=2593640 RepID=UPI0013EA14FD|nr:MULTISPECIES: hypothetical protein [unclassified Desulfovibrio]
MKIIALEEHIVSQPISKATAKAVADAYPYAETFLHPAAADMPDVAQLFSLGEQRVAILDKAGIDMEVVSYTNASQWLTGAEAATLTKQPTTTWPRPSSHGPRASAPLRPSPGQARRRLWRS